MGKKCIKISLAAVFTVVLSSSLCAQGAGDVLRYGLQYPSYDPVSVVMPGVSDATGFGAYQENPAVMGLFDHSFFSAGLSDRYTTEDGTYLGNTTGFDDNQANISNLGFVYNVPTAQGKLAIGGGYSQSHDFNRAIAGNGRNNSTSITDFYADLRDENGNPLPLNEAAFNAFAIDDYQDGNGNIQSLSIFRFLPAGQQYPGIDQNFELTERGVIGEFSAFIATEFLRNLVVGASVGVTTGTYEQRRNFLETDTQGDYNGAIIDSDNDGTDDTDVADILSVDSIDDTFSGFSFRLGAVYQITPNFSIGGSYQFKNVLNIDEDFSTTITTNLDNGATPFEGEDLGEIEYKVVRPARANFGFTAKDFGSLTLSASGEYVAYSDGRIRFDDLEFKDAEVQENNIVENSLEDVVNLRFGLQYKVNEQFSPRIGYGYYPSPTGEFANADLNGDRQFYSAGFTARISEFTTFNLGAQLGIWDDQNTLYSSSFGDAVVQEDVTHWNILGGITFDF